jgi:hypothetical protein
MAFTFGQTSTPAPAFSFGVTGTTAATTTTAPFGFGTAATSTAGEHYWAPIIESLDKGQIEPSYSCFSLLHAWSLVVHGGRCIRKTAPQTLSKNKVSEIY